jgi:hypothetical protein
MRNELRISPAENSGNGCATDVSAACEFGGRRFADVVSPHVGRPNVRCADSESRFLAIKKFSPRAASHHHGVSQNHLFARIDCG